jgi:hypothetical protein
MRVTLFMLFTSVLASFPAQASAQVADQASYYYRNGVRHTVRIDPDRQVDLATGRGTAPKIVPTGRNAKAVADTTALFIDISTQSEQALPGGVLVTAKASTSAEQMLAMLRAQGVSQASAVVGTQVWIVPSAPGLPALQLANRLHESGAFLAVEPNWWRKRRAK